MTMTSIGGRVLVGVDGTDANRHAVAWAVGQARADRSEVLAVYAWHVPALAYETPAFMEIDPQEMEKYAHQMFQGELDDLQEPAGVPIEVQAVNGQAHVALRDLARQPATKLVVVGTRGRGTAAGMVLGSVSHSLSHECPKPLVVVPGTGSPGVEHIVVGVDGSEGAAVALRWAAAEARVRQARLEAVTAYTTDSMRAGAESALHDAVQGLDTDRLMIDLTVREGRPAEVLLERAEAADLLVVGTRGLGRARELFLGSVSHACVHRSPVAVAVVPEPGRGG
jgi:nucleotide-binding universal stress UspA family protein